MSDDFDPALMGETPTPDPSVAETRCTCSWTREGLTPGDGRCPKHGTFAGETPTPAKTCDDCGEYEQDCGCGGVKVRARLAKAEALLDKADSKSLLPDWLSDEIRSFLAGGDPDA